MKLEWSEDKNRRLRALRGIGFEDVLAAIEEGHVLDDFAHPDQRKYAGQRILVVAIRSCACLVPHVRTDGRTFLRTIYPSRKAHRRYLETDPK